MLGNKDAVANIAVRNLETARRFYEDTLGLKPVCTEGGELIVFRSGNSTLDVYRSQYAGTNQATAVTWVVGDDVEVVVRALKAKGISFEHYDMPEMSREGDVLVALASGRRTEKKQAGLLAQLRTRSRYFWKFSPWSHAGSLKPSSATAHAASSKAAP